MTARRKSSLQASVASCPAILADQAVFETAVALLGDLDAGFVATLLSEAATVSLRRREPGFEGLVSIIVAQQVSTASANAIFARVKARFGALAATDVLAAGDDDLKLCGLSAPKIRAIRAIAAAVASGALDFEALATADAETAHATLTAIKGIGPWTADVFLLFGLGHADAWPAGDLALQEGARLALGLVARPTTAELVAIGERWRPLRGVAAHCLWAYYGAARGRSVTPDVTGTASKKPAKTKTTKTKTTKTTAGKTETTPKLKPTRKRTA